MRRLQLIAKLAFITLITSVGHASAESSGPAPGYRRLRQTVDDFAVPLTATAKDYQQFSRLAARRSLLGPTEALDRTSSGVAHLVTEKQSSGVSFALVRESSLVSSSPKEAQAGESALDLAAPWTFLKSPFQPKVVGWSVRYRGHGKLRIEALGERPQRLNVTPCSDWCTATGNFSKRQAKSRHFQLIAEPNSDVTFDDLELLVDVPALPSLELGALMSYAQLMRCWDPARGRVSDHAQFTPGDFDVVPGLGFVALSSAVFADLGFVELSQARELVARAVQSVGTIPRLKGWLPHWVDRNGWLPSKTVDGALVEGSEISTVDTALTYWPLLLAARMLELDGERDTVEKLIAELDFAAALSSDGGLLSHGFKQDGSPLAKFWDSFGSESLLVELLYYYQTPEAPLLKYDRKPPVFGGRTFIQDMAALLFEQAGGNELVSRDRFGVNWYGERVNLMRAQQTLAGGELYGYSPVELIDAAGNTGYCELGSGRNQDDSAILSCHGFDDLGVPWIALHASALNAALEPSKAAARVERLIDTGLMQPLSGPAEAVVIGKQHEVLRYHAVQTALNAFFNALGYAQAIYTARGGPNPIYKAGARDLRLNHALGRLWPLEAGQSDVIMATSIVAPQAVATGVARPPGAGTPPAVSEPMANAPSTSESVAKAAPSVDESRAQPRSSSEAARQ